MIEKTKIFPVGKIIKTHGLKGELVFTSDYFSLKEVAIAYIILEPDGILVPFFVSNIRFKSNVSGYIQLEGITTESKGKLLAGQTIYLPQEYAQAITEDDVRIEYLTGFEVEDEMLGKVGKIVEIDDSTANVLFVVIGEGNKEFFIPATETFMVEIDDRNKILRMNLPEGLLEL
ncbi:MAG: ribosome maturation factor RimM [Paludibacteraceae bacterium]